MTAKHVIEKLNEENNWFIVLNNDHEVALLVNALIDCNYKLKNDGMHYVGIYKCNLEVHTTAYKDLKYISESCDDIIEWFFKEVNNY